MMGDSLWERESRWCLWCGRLYYVWRMPDTGYADVSKRENTRMADNGLCRKCRRVRPGELPAHPHVEPRVHDYHKGPSYHGQGLRLLEGVVGDELARLLRRQAG